MNSSLELSPRRREAGKVGEAESTPKSSMPTPSDNSCSLVTASSLLRRVSAKPEL